MSDPEIPVAEAADPITLVEMTADLVASCVERNHVQGFELPALIATVHASLAGLGNAHEVAPEPVKAVPPVSIRKSVTDAHLISL